MKLHAGSLYKNYLVLYGEEQTPIVIQVDDENLQWEMYCEDVDVEMSTKDDGKINVHFKNYIYRLPYIETSTPMKALDKNIRRFEMARPATYKDLWHGKITITWVKKPTPFYGSQELPAWMFKEACDLLGRLLGGKFVATVETDSKEVLKTA